MNKHETLPLNPMHEQIALNIIERAGHYDSAYPVLREYFHKRGWVYGQVGGQWATQSVAPDTRGINGPRFDTFGELLTWLFEQPELPKE